MYVHENVDVGPRKIPFKTAGSLWDPRDDRWWSAPLGFVPCTVVVLKRCVCSSTEDGHPECGPEDRGAGWIWKDLQKWYCHVSHVLMACVQFLLEQGCPDPVLTGHNPAGSSVLPGRNHLGSRLNRHPSWAVALKEWVRPPLLSRSVLIDFCVLPNQHGLTMPMHALFSMQEPELWKLTSQGTLLLLHTTWETNHIVVVMAALDLLNFITRTGKRTRWGLLMDGWNSLIRYYKNNFSDGFRQVCTSPRIHLAQTFAGFCLVPLKTPYS